MASTLERGHAYVSGPLRVQSGNSESLDHRVLRNACDRMTLSPRFRHSLENDIAIATSLGEELT